MNGTKNSAWGQLGSAVCGLTDGVQQTPEHCIANRCLDWCAQGARGHAAAKPGRIAQRDGPDCHGIKMLLDLRQDGRGLITIDHDALIEGR